MKTFTELTPQERNDLIAVHVLGWKVDREYFDGYLDASGKQTQPRIGNHIGLTDCFDPSSDLNACHLVEQKMDGEHKFRYIVILNRMVGKDAENSEQIYFAYVHATASQKTEAILRAYNLIS